MKVIRWISNMYGWLDILVNNVGVWVEKEEYEGDVLCDMFEVNIFGFYYFIELLMFLFLKSEVGWIVN